MPVSPRMNLPGPGPWIQPPHVGGVAPQTFNQPMDATTVVVTASIATSIAYARTLAATAVVVTASMVRQVNKSMSGTAVAVTASFVKTVNKALTATSVVVTASMLAIKVILKTLTATSVVVTASMSRSVTKFMSSTAVVVTASIVKQVNKRLTASSVVVTASLTAIRVFLKTMTATAVVVSASMGRRVNTTLTATVAATGSMVKQVAKRLTAGAVSVLASLVTAFIPAGGAVGFSGPFDSDTEAGRSDALERDADYLTRQAGRTSARNVRGGYTSVQRGKIGSE